MLGRPTRTRMPRIALPTLAAAAVLVVLCVGAAAQNVPESQQVPIFLKMLTYDRTLSEHEGPLRIAVLTGESSVSRDNGKAFLAALLDKSDKTVNGRSFSCVHLSWSDAVDLAAALVRDDIDILYASRDLDKALPLVAESTRAAGVLTLAGDGDDVRRGLSIGLGLSDGRPRITVNLDALAGEGHDLESRALRLCEVVNGS